MKITVCTWDPTHTLQRVRMQDAARRDGTIEGLRKQHGATPALVEAMKAAGLVTMTDGDGYPMCVTCGAMMDTVLTRPGITDRLEAMRDVAQGFSAAIDRTRKAKASGRF